MSFIRRLFGQQQARRSEAVLVETGVAEDFSPDELVEVEVVGEGTYQDALERIAGPKQERGKQLRVGTTLRCEPGNKYDSNAVRVEVMGQLVGYVSRTEAARVAPALRSAGGAIEAQGVIVGGWRDRDSEGHFGCRVWLTPDQANRLGLVRPSPAPRQWPQWPAPTDAEVRLSPAPGSDSLISTLTVTCEEHYQPTIAGSRPTGLDGPSWPVLLAFALADCNPHAKAREPCIQVVLAGSGSPVGYLTSAMTKRHSPRVAPILSSGRQPTLHGIVETGTKGGVEIWRVKGLLTS